MCGQVISQPCVRRGHAFFFEPAMVGGWVIQYVAEVVKENFHVSVFVGCHTGAEYQLGAVAQRQTGHAVIAVLLGCVVIGLIRQASQVGWAFEVEDIDREEVVIAPALHGVAFGMGIVCA
ncbi:hypothetical protein D3C77_683970 [compost metagenome]